MVAPRRSESAVSARRRSVTSVWLERRRSFSVAPVPRAAARCRGGTVGVVRIPGTEYKSSTTIGAWPLVHVCAGIDPVTMRPKIAKGVVAIGNVAVGVVAIGGLACGLFTVGGVSIGLLLAVGGAAIGVGISVGGVAVGSVAIGGAAVGFLYAIGGSAFGPAVIDGRQCDEAARDFARRWLNVLPSGCQ